MLQEFLGELSIRFVMWGLFAIFLFAALWFMLRRRWMLMAAIACVALLVGVIVVERLIVTDREQLRRNLQLITEALRRNDVERLLTFISDTQPQLKRRAASEMEQMTFRDCRVVAEHAILIERNPSAHIAKFDFTAHANVDSASSYGYTGSGRAGVVLTWQKETDGRWRVIDCEVYDARQF